MSDTMNRVITFPPTQEPQADGSVTGGWWHDAPDGRIVCDLCPRECRLKPGDRGFCFVRENRDGQVVLTTYGRSTGFCIDPIEKKPLNHFYPGTSVLSFGTAGCNLGCKFCQNWSISKSREIRQLSQSASPASIALAAADLKCRSVAFTYNDPVIWAEYAIDTARECRAHGIKTVAVTAGYISPVARPAFYEFMDAANVDLKGFTEHFYQQLTLSHLQPVLDTLVWLHRETNVWFEITNLVIPGENDDDDEFRRMCDWIVQQLGPNVPVHFTAFHPDFRLNDRPSTPVETLLRAHEFASQAGIRFAYIGNVDDPRHQSTYCPSCGDVVIERNWYELGRYNLDGNVCRKCGQPIPGHFDAEPGSWGRRRSPVNMNRYATIGSRPAQIDSPSISRQENRPMPPHQAHQPDDRIADGPARPELTERQRSAVVQATSLLVQSAVLRQPVAWPDESLAGAAELPVLGCFVSIKRKGRLRGCCGFLGRTNVLRQALVESATSSAIGDVRMPSIVPEELPHLDFEIWLLYAMRAVIEQGDERVKAVEIGRHGLQIQLGQSRGLLLPGVATDHGFDAPTFLQQVCVKAGLPATAWKDDLAQLHTFEGSVVRGSFSAANLDDAVATPLRFDPAEIDRLVLFCRENVWAISRGAQPNYYVSGVTDGAVNGVCLTVSISGRDEQLQLARIVLRNPLPLQSTLFQMCEAAASRIRDEGLRLSQSVEVQVDLAILYGPAMQGTVHEPDLDGFDPRRRAMFVTQGNKSAWRYDPQQTAGQLLAVASQHAHVTVPQQAAVYSFVAQASRTPVQAANVPQPRRGPSVRPPVAAKMFYPGDPGKLSQLLDELTPSEPVDKQTWRAALVPHAGLVYSGRIAADVLRRIKMPRSIIVLGPKHTALGVEWAVAPHESWSLPGITVASDRELAEQLCQAIDGLQLDAAAHEQEHAIEVELPWIARWAPDARVVGIALGGADLDRCHQFAAGLAAVLKARSEDTLLVISSDMNHFANDTETRRVDALAIGAMKALDPDRLYHTVRDHQISMCGMIPACIVLSALKQLQQLTEAAPIAYGTSGDVSGDLSRVVGYAGMLFR
jgi:AmmeMemoRadiSam system radical SAM enzyme/AmmeMemoRadiSam system protein B/AmmeMemoRadiSam system protein A